MMRLQFWLLSNSYPLAYIVKKSTFYTNFSLLYISPRIGVRARTGAASCWGWFWHEKLMQLCYWFQLWPYPLAVKNLKIYTQYFEAALAPASVRLRLRYWKWGGSGVVIWCYLRLISIKNVLSSKKIILAYICKISVNYHTVHAAGGYAVGPYTDHFSKGQNHGKKFKFRKNLYK
jgi:hypothetical protein